MRGAQLDRLAFEPSSWDCAAADHECQVFGRAAQRRARSVRPVKVGGLEAASFMPEGRHDRDIGLLIETH